jgi:hypothetical protein
MEKIFDNVTGLKTDEEYALLKSHVNGLIDEATTNGYLSEQGADNEFSREIARLGRIGAIYETEALHLPVRVINPSVPKIEKEIRPRVVSHAKVAELMA